MLEPNTGISRSFILLKAPRKRCFLISSSLKQLKCIKNDLFFKKSITYRTSRIPYINTYGTISAFTNVDLSFTILFQQLFTESTQCWKWHEKEEEKTTRRPSDWGDSAEWECETGLAMNCEKGPAMKINYRYENENTNNACEKGRATLEIPTSPSRQ